MSSSLVASPQVIHTISVVDRDEPLSGHHFIFTLDPEASSNRRFTLGDVKGECPRIYAAALMTATFDFLLLLFGV